MPDGGRYIEENFTNSAGSRAYKLYIPSGYQGQAVPLIVMLHGGTQTPDDFATGTRMNVMAEKETCLVVYPAQPCHANPAKCWNCLRPDDQRRDRGEPSLIAGITRQVMHDYSVDPRRVYAGGLSAGAAAAAVMGNLPGSICGNCSAFRPSVRGRRRSYLRLRRDAAWRPQTLLRLTTLRAFLKNARRSRPLFFMAIATP